MLCPAIPVSVNTSVRTNGDSVMTPLAVAWGSRMGTRTVRTRSPRTDGHSEVILVAILSRLIFSSDHADQISSILRSTSRSKVSSLQSRCSCKPEIGIRPDSSLSYEGFPILRAPLRWLSGRACENARGNRHQFERRQVRCMRERRYLRLSASGPSCPAMLARAASANAARADASSWDASPLRSSLRSLTIGASVRP